MGKTNAQHLRLLIAKEEFDRDEAMEFIGAIENDIEEMETEIKDKDKTIESLEEDVKILETQEEENKKEIQRLQSCRSMKSIEIGGGVLYYQTDDLNIQSMMDDMKVKYHGHSLA